LPDYTKLYEQFKTIAMNAVRASSPAGITFGTVTSVNPLSIRIDEKKVLTSPFLVLTSLVSNFTVNVTVDHRTDPETAHMHAIEDTYTGGGSSQPTTHYHEVSGTKDVQVNLGLKIGEKVALIKDQGGQKFIVLDRVR
jgi:hypothetical protein